MKVRYGGKGEGGTRLWRWDMEGRERGALAYEGEIWRYGKGGHSLIKVRYGGKGEGGTRLWRWDMEGRDGLGNAIFFQWDFVGKRCYITKQGNLRKQATTTIQVKVEVKWYDKKEKNDLQLNLVAARWWIRNEAFWQTEVSWRHEYSLYSVEKMTERKMTWKWRPHTTYRKWDGYGL